MQLRYAKLASNFAILVWLRPTYTGDDRTMSMLALRNGAGDDDI